MTSEWISVKDRLPEKSGYYLTYCDGWIAQYPYSAKHKKFNTHDFFSAEEAKGLKLEVSHWMPLWQPPEEKNKKEEQMERNNKPRLCEILGVEPMEKFRVDGYDGDICILSDGCFKYLQGNGVGASAAVFRALEEPERVHRYIQYLTKCELALCNMLQEVNWATMDKNDGAFVKFWHKKPKLIDDEWVSPHGWIASISSVYFPSIKKGDCIDIFTERKTWDLKQKNLTADN